MTIKTIAASTAAALLLGVGAAQAVYADERLAVERFDAVLQHAEQYGFVMLDEIEIDDDGRVEIEGWLEDQWHAEVTLSVEDGQALHEDRRRLDRDAWGMSFEEARMALTAASGEGLVEIESLDVDASGRVEIEGYDAEGREIEVTTRQGEEGVERVKHD